MTDTAHPSTATRNPFKPGVALALVLAAVLAMLGMAVLGAWAPELSNGDDGGQHALSKSAVGYGGVARLLRGMNRTVVLSRGDLRGGGRNGLLILTPPPGREDRALDDLIRNRPVLIVLPKWQTMDDVRHKGWSKSLGVMPADESLSVLPARLRNGARLDAVKGATSVELTQAGRPIGAGLTITDPRTFAGPGWTPVITDPAGRALVLVRAGTQIHVLTDPDLLNTLGLDSPAKARAALATIDAVGGADRPVIFDLSLNGFSRPRSLMRLLMEPPLLGFTLCLLAAVLLIGWQAVIRFEPHLDARRAVAPGKTALADNTAALARLARREHRMARPYAELVRGLAARAVAAPHGLAGDALTALLDRLAARHGDTTRYQDLLARAEAARTPADLMSVAAALIRWKSEMTRGRD